MRHLVAKDKLGRTRNQRAALMKNLMQNFFASGKINTTKTKAKFIAPLIDRAIRRAQKGGLANIRHLAVILNKDLTKKLITDIAPSYTRLSGFTRIISLGFRRGDNAEVVRLELLDKDVEIIKEQPKTQVKESPSTKASTKNPKPAKISKTNARKSKTDLKK